MSYADWSVASNVLYVCMVAWLAYRGLVARYIYQVVLVMTLIYASVSYHLCWTHELQWCAGSWANGRDISLSRDVMAAFQATSAVSILVDQWWMHAMHANVFAAYVAAVQAATWWFVALWGDDLVSVLSLVLPQALVLAYAFVREVRGKNAHSVWWMVRAGLAAVAIALGIVFRQLSLDMHDAEHHVGDDTQLLYHGIWHALTAAGSFLAVSLLPAVEPTKAYHPVGKA